jgi:hypothetical protein
MEDLANHLSGAVQIRRNRRRVSPLAEPDAACQRAIKKAQLLAQLACSEVEKYHPAHDLPPEMRQIGFDFSPAAVTRLTGRNRRPGRPTWGAVKG